MFSGQDVKITFKQHRCLFTDLSVLREKCGQQMTASLKFLVAFLVALMLLFIYQQTVLY